LEDLDIIDPSYMPYYYYYPHQPVGEDNTAQTTEDLEGRVMEDARVRARVSPNGIIIHKAVP